ncbi:BTB/POZ protein [Triangularia verruculosa]|uniref:BTB/POZ protein n=1 Tax=Triangularia verruculosa TaxID=2587418 RepID=A0AAN7AT53_9PEZI|nr:BTB/POZ protein [Triangularia verruculosa]
MEPPILAHPSRPSAPPQYNEMLNACLEPVTLNVSGRKFTTTINTLNGRSLFFAQVFQGDWKSSRQEDGSIFIDSNPEVFSHVLQYLRRGVFPLAYDQRRGHDYKLYADILAEAKFFGIPKLECWLVDQLYLRCITSSTVWSSAYKDDRIQTGFQTTSVWGSDVISTQMVRQDVTTVRNSVCYHQAQDRTAPCSHRGCRVSADGVKDDVETFRWAEVGRSIRFVQGWCIDTGWVCWSCQN